MADQITSSLAEAKILVMQGMKGEDGFSPTVEVQDIVQSLPGGGTEVIGHKVIITDANGQHIFNVMNGEDGEGGEGGGGGAAEAVLYIAQSLTAAQKAQARTNIDAGTYSKPSGGIPASDLASGVIPVVPQMATQADMSDWTSGKTVDAATLKTNFTGAMTLLSRKADISDIPTAVSELTNDSGFQTAAQVQGAIDAIPGELPAVSAADNDKFLRVVNGAWAAETVQTYQGGSY